MVNGNESTYRATRRVWLAAFAAFALFAPGCQTWQSFKARTNHIRSTILSTGYEDQLAPEKLAAADQLFNEGKYVKAREMYRGIADNQLNSAELAEQARFMQAECRRNSGEYPEAIDTYHKLLMDFPTGAHKSEALQRVFEIADYWLDDFRDELQKRAGEQGVLKWHPAWKSPFDKSKPWIGQEGRTLDALDYVWTYGMTGPLADKALWWCGYVNYIRGNFQEADHFFSTLVQLHKDSPLYPQAMAYAIISKNNGTGGADYDGRKCAEALELVHTAEATIPELAQNGPMADKLTRAKFAIRSQQAEKDFRMAEYYQRTGHPGSAVFYYELVRRRYAGTKYSDIATDRKEYLLAQMRSGKPMPGNDPIAIASVKWKELFSKNKTQTYEEHSLDEKAPVQTAGGGMPPANVVPAGGPFRQGP